MNSLPAGHEFTNPHNPSQGYRLTRSVRSGDKLRSDQFEAFGGAPEPKDGHPLPQWLAQQLDSLRST